VEQYRNNKTKTVRQIARELEVNFIVEGSGQKYGDQVMLSVQLIDANSEKHIFSEQYTRKWEEVFNLYSEISTLVATSIKAVITPEEAEMVEKKPTKIMEAYNIYLRGGDLQRTAQTMNDTNLLRLSGDYFRKAIRLDSTFADVYQSLGWTVSMLKNEYDSALFYANRALHFDDKNSDAYFLKGWVFLFHSTGDKLMEAEKAFNLGVKYNPNNSSGYNFLGQLYWKKGEYLHWIDNILKALNLAKDPWERWVILTSFCRWLNQSGFYEEALIYSRELIEYNNDSLDYYRGKTGQQMFRLNYDSAYTIAQIAVRSKKWEDTFNPLFLANLRMFKNDYPTALKHVEEYIGSQEKQGEKITPNGMIGFIYMKNGLKEKAAFHFDGNIQNQLKLLEETQPDTRFWNYFNLMHIYSAKGEKEKALENFRKAVKCKEPESAYFYVNTLINFKYSPMYETIREEPEFMKFIRLKEDKYMADREKIKKLFREAGLYN